jgi:dTDP-glucose 4,6-dehydratase
MSRYLVTGGAGFIGSNLVRELLAAEATAEVTVLDKMTYAGNAAALAAHAARWAAPRFAFVRGDVADRPCVREVLASRRPEVILHLAAESHVDRSIDAPADFIATNVVGTCALLDECRHYLAGGG